MVLFFSLRWACKNPLAIPLLPLISRKNTGGAFAAEKGPRRIADQEKLGLWPKT